MFEYKTDFIPMLNNKPKKKSGEILSLIAETIDNYLLKRSKDGWELVVYSVIQGVSVYNNSNIKGTMITTKRKKDI